MPNFLAFFTLERGEETVAEQPRAIFQRNVGLETFALELAKSDALNAMMGIRVKEG